MNKKEKKYSCLTIITVLNIITIVLLLIVTISGVCSFYTKHFFETVNQYGETIKMWGTGVYAHDSFFKASISIGSDFTILFFVVPFAIITFMKLHKKPNVEHYIQSFGVMSLLLYYSASLAFGVTYNHLHLLYIALFGMCFYSVGFLFVKLQSIEFEQKKVCDYHITKGMKIYLIIAGISLFVAWLPDIATSLINGTSLDLIEVYTTEVTYVLDMGIISPLMFLTLYLLKRKSFLGYIFFRMILNVCIAIGIMLPIQSIFQLMSGISIPIPALITKILIFVLLAASAVFFEYCLKRETQYTKR